MFLSHKDSDPFLGAGFQIHVAGIAAGFFQEVSGLAAQIESMEIEEGGRNNTTRKLVGKASFPNLVFKRGFCNGTLYSAIVDFHQLRRRLHGSIAMLTQSGSVAAEWAFTNGIPVKWEGPSLNVSNNQIAVESLEIAHEGLHLIRMMNVDRSGRVTGLDVRTTARHWTQMGARRSNVPSAGVGVSEYLSRAEE